jgi:Flp pilus assembly protein TadG
MNETGWSEKRASRRGERGGAAVEFALVLPLFMALVMGALDYGYFFFSDQIVTNAAREGARAGTLVDPTSGGADSTGATKAKAAARAYMLANGIDCPTHDDTCITVYACHDNTNSCSNPNPVTNNIASVDVLIQYAAVSLTGFTSVILPAKVKARAVMRWQ